MTITRYSDIQPYLTKDGSEVRELMHPGVHGNARQSLAEAIVQPGAATLPHRHGKTEELYHVTAGRGLLTVGERQIEVSCGDTACIPPGTVHWVQNIGDGPLKILCCCAPPYSHEDTELVG
jgi:mannose-6-phosphate isomerase-like protein (cupin superfamily)